jgi:capsular exopolysaccharide synthesis family protein
LTSARPCAGTTTTTGNLAIALAAEGRKVALVDANLRAPGIARLFGIDPEIGLTTVLTGVVALEKAMQSWGGELSLDILTSGVLPPNPSKFVGSERMSSLIKDLRAQYEVVVIDFPPLLEEEDAAVLAVKVDGAVLVCRAGRTSTSDAVAAIDVLDAAGANLLGTVLTFGSKRGLISAILRPSIPQIRQRSSSMRAAPNVATASESTSTQIG